MNPAGTFQDGIRKKPVSLSSLPLSGRLIPEFNRRRNLKDMFRTASNSEVQPASNVSRPQKEHNTQWPSPVAGPGVKNKGIVSVKHNALPSKRVIDKQGTAPAPKRSKTMHSVSKTQATLARFIKSPQLCSTFKNERQDSESQNSPRESKEVLGSIPPQQLAQSSISNSFESSVSAISPQCIAVDPIDCSESNSGATSRESWAKLFTKRAAPNCEGHNEPCTVLVTKKPGPNRGRSFWICPRPLGPSGEKETGTSWRCSTFIWCSDWKSQGQT